MLILKIIRLFYLLIIKRLKVYNNKMNKFGIGNNNNKKLINKIKKLFKF